MNNLKNKILENMEENFKSYYNELNICFDIESNEKHPSGHVKFVEFYVTIENVNISIEKEMLGYITDANNEKQPCYETCFIIEYEETCTATSEENQGYNMSCAVRHVFENFEELDKFLETDFDDVDTFQDYELRWE